LDLDRDLIAEHRLLERDRDRDLHVLAARWAARTTPAATEGAGATEKGIEDVAQSATAEYVLDVRPTGCTTDSGLAETVGAGGCLVIRPNGVGPRDLLETVGRCGIVGIGVGVELARSLAVRL